MRTATQSSGIAAIGVRRRGPNMILAALGALAFTLATVPSAQALNPSRTYKQLPSKYNMKYEAADVKTNDGAATLKAWIFAAKGPTKSLPPVLMLHSGQGNMADYLRRVDALTASGRAVVTFDYRGFGESSDFEIDNNMFIYPHFQDDTQSMIDFVRKKLGSKIDLYGWGIGGGLALGIGWSRPEVRRIVADTPFLSMEDLEDRLSSWDEPMEVPFAGYKKGFEPIHTVMMAPGKQLQKVTLVVGSNDVLMKVDDMKGLAKRNKKLIDKQVFVVENPDRKDNFRIDKAGYAKRLTAALGGK